jgi:hypothetical protein
MNWNLAEIGDATRGAAAGRQSDQLIPEAKTEKTSHRWKKIEEDVLPAADRSTAKGSWHFILVVYPLSSVANLNLF